MYRLPKLNFKLINNKREIRKKKHKQLREKYLGLRGNLKCLSIMCKHLLINIKAKHSHFLKTKACNIRFQHL